MKDEIISIGITVWVGSCILNEIVKAIYPNKPKSFWELMEDKGHDRINDKNL